jgi:hypothetical protein
MSIGNSRTWSANFVLPFLFFAVFLAWGWTASSILHTHPWLVTGDIGGPAQSALCALSFFPAVLVWGVVLLCDRTERATRTLGYVSAAVALTTALAVLLLFFLPYSSTGGQIPFSTFPQAFPPYSWGEAGSILRWLALNVVFPYGPYLGWFSLAVLLFLLTCRFHLFSWPIRAAGWVTAISCGALFFAIMPMWAGNLVWFYLGSSIKALR